MNKRTLLTLGVLLAFAALHDNVNRIYAQGNAFTYHGRLSDNGTVTTGQYDIRFQLFDAVTGGSQVGGLLSLSPVPVTNGLFMVTLDFGVGAFPGSARWLQMGLRTNGSAGAFTPLNPRQALTATPYAVTAGDVTAPNIARLNVPNTATAATGAPTVSFGFIVNATLSSGGSGYGTTPAVTVNDSTGSGAVVTATVSGGAVVSLSVQNPGSGYSAGATLTIGAPPSNAFQTFPGVNYFTGVNTLNNPNNTFAGSFAGNFTGSFSGAGVLPWQVVSSTTQQAQPNSGYLLTNDALVTVTLPASPAPGDLVRISSSGAGGWRIAQNAGQAVIAKNLPGNFGANWAPHYTPQNWISIASSSDGNKLLAAAFGGQIYTSTDPGVTWTPRDSSRSWYSVASSADGGKLVAVVNNGQIYTSTNSGVTWTPRATDQAWTAVASSSGGDKIVAVAGLIYTSSDSGQTWDVRDVFRSWSSIASSSDGNNLVAVVSGGQIFVSTDAGITWTPRDNSGGWNSVASSSDGSKLVAAGGQIYTSSSVSILGAAGYLLGNANAAIELQYIGGGKFIPLSHEGTIIAY